MKLYEPTSQEEYVETLAQLEAAVVETKHAERNLAVERMQKQKTLNAAAAAWVSEHPQLSHVECLKAVSETSRMVRMGELPSAPIGARPNNPIDQYPRGRGYYDPAAGRIVHVGKPSPKPAPTNTRPMHADGTVTRGGFVK